MPKTLEEALAVIKERDEQITTFKKDVGVKDALILQKTEDIALLRKNSEAAYKKLSDMTAEEKAAMSDKEIELQKRVEDQDTKTAEFEKRQADFLQRETDSRRGQAIKSLVGSNKELTQQVEDAFKKIVGHDKAQTEEEIASIAKSAFNMLGVPKPDSVHDVVHNGMGGEAGGVVREGDYANSEAGKSLMTAFGVPAEVIKAAEAAK